MNKLPESLLQRLVVPVASKRDAAATREALVPRIDSTNEVVAIHVIEKAQGALDKASVEQREEAAREIFAILREGFADIAIPLETEIHYGPDVADTIIDAAHDARGSAIVFTPRGGSRWQRLISGDITHRILSHSDLPILVLPHVEPNES